MKVRALIIIAITIAFSTSAPGHPPCQKGVDTSKAVLQVMRLESRWVRAVMRRDAKALGRILADDYVGMDSDGTVRDKKQTLEEMRTASVGFESITPDNFDVRVSGERVSVNGRVVVKVRVEDRLIASQFSYTRVYVHRKGKWQVVQARTTRLGE